MSNRGYTPDLPAWFEKEIHGISKLQGMACCVAGFSGYHAALPFALACMWSAAPSIYFVHACELYPQAEDPDNFWVKLTLRLPPLLVCSFLFPPGRAGGAYIPPFRLARMMAEIDDKNSAAAQKLSWEALRKSLNGLINKVGPYSLRCLVLGWNV